MKNLYFRATPNNSLGIAHIEAASSLTKGIPGDRAEGFMPHRPRI